MQDIENAIKNGAMRFQCNFANLERLKKYELDCNKCDLPRFYIVIDIDKNHADGVDGFENFMQVLTQENKTEGIFAAFPNNFPFYVITKNKGIHAYFYTHSIKVLAQAKAKICEGVEIKIDEITAAGSVDYDANKELQPYQAIGDFNNVAKLPRFLEALIIKKPPQRIELVKAARFQGFLSKSNNIHDLFYNFARKNSAQGGHNDFFSRFSYAASKNGFSAYETKLEILNSAEYAEWTDYDKDRQIENIIHGKKWGGLNYES